MRDIRACTNARTHAHKLRVEYLSNSMKNDGDLGSRVLRAHCGLAMKSL